MKKIRSISICLLFIINGLYAQHSAKEYKQLRDSLQILSNYDTISFFRITRNLEKIVSALPDQSKKADVLQIIGSYYYFRTDDKHANKYYDSAITILNKYPNRKLLNEIELKRSFILINKGDYSSAKGIYILKEREEQNDTLAQILLNMAFSQIYQMQSKIDSGLIKTYKALNYAVLSKDKYYEATIRNNLGAIYQGLNKNKEAKNEFSIAKGLATEIQNKKLVTSINNNIATILISENKIEEAINIYKQNLSFYKNSNFFYEIAYTHLNLASCYQKAENYSNFETEYKLSLKTIIDNDIKNEIFNFYTFFTDLYIKIKNFKNVIHLSDEAIDFSKKKNLPIQQPLFYYNLSTAYEEVGDNTKALQMIKKYIHIKDSIDYESNLKNLNELIVKHQLVENENENKLLKKENELIISNKKINTIIIIAGFAFIILIVLLIFQQIVKKQKAIYSLNLINQIDNERERIAMDLHDDIGIEITMAKQKISDENFHNSTIKKEVENQLAVILEKTRKISRDLFPSTLKLIHFNTYIDELLKVIEFQTNIICSYEIDDIINDLDISTKTHISRIIQECLHNTLKYAHATAIRIEGKVVNDKIEMHYFDNGIGLAKHKKHNGIGLQTIKQRAQIINASINIENNTQNNGIKITLILNGKS